MMEVSRGPVLRFGLYALIKQANIILETDQHCLHLLTPLPERVVHCEPSSLCRCLPSDLGVNTTLQMRCVELGLLVHTFAPKWHIAGSDRWRCFTRSKEL